MKNEKRTWSRSSSYRAGPVKITLLAKTRNLHIGRVQQKYSRFQEFIHRGQRGTYSFDHNLETNVHRNRTPILVSCGLFPTLLGSNLTVAHTKFYNNTHFTATGFSEWCKWTWSAEIKNLSLHIESKYDPL